MDRHSFKEINPLWSLVDPLTVEQAAALIAGVDPNSVDDSGHWFKNRETGLTDSDGITWVQTAFAALVNAINARKLKVTIRRAAWERGRRTGRARTICTERENSGRRCRRSMAR